MPLVASLAQTTHEDGGELRAKCSNAACGHIWVVAYLPLALESVATLSKCAACPKCADADPHVFPSSPRAVIDAVTAAACPQNALAWISGPDTGASSKTIWKHMVGTSCADKRYPLDPSDLGRCVRLLVLVPEWRLRMGEMAEHCAVWAALVEAWDELTDLILEEVGLDGTKNAGMAPRTYARMRAIRRPLEHPL